MTTWKLSMITEVLIFVGITLAVAGVLTAVAHFAAESEDDT
jgi:hypothetical protein